MKIKTKKRVNIPELIKYAWENDVREKWFYSDNQAQKSSYGVEFDEDGDFISRVALNSDLLFTVEVEEEITEDTVIDEMLLIYDNGVTHIAENKNLSFISKGNLKSAYYMNDDLRLILIWRDGRLIE
ncbi:hypothetical protein [Staphylococcus ureilyticus]|uniref:hypothetical protein n=1 Tax=Staphylococcus ureilyticus TaxID=94138 RepID=UPI0028FF723B|nr:hypothetical protein [Staphylococcus ureilyticus]MDU0461953.1 hypothetical protein [Staphylococcus ureilyticus]